VQALIGEALGTVIFDRSCSGGSRGGSKLVTRPEPKRDNIEGKLMNWKSRVPLIGMIGAFLLGPNALAADSKVQKYKHSDIDMPVSLALGRVRTPEFAVVDEAYFIMIQLEKRLPFQEMRCMMALASNSFEKEPCPGGPLLQAEWTVLEKGRVVSKGESSLEGHGMSTNTHMYKIMGPFVGEAGKKYVVELNFTRDGTPLNVCKPHLIVVRVRYH
jgi:hypothetical protein